jgi:hypothetical protein
MIVDIDLHAISFPLIPFALISLLPRLYERLKYLIHRTPVIVIPSPSAD